LKNSERDEKTKLVMEHEASSRLVRTCDRSSVLFRSRES
jgi:hypothetical protein